nr:hypothetical protein [Chitinimonas koreensis]
MGLVEEAQRQLGERRRFGFGQPRHRLLQPEALDRPFRRDAHVVAEQALQAALGDAELLDQRGDAHRSALGRRRRDGLLGQATGRPARAGPLATRPVRPHLTAIARARTPPCN